MKKHGLIIINSFSYSEIFKNQTKRLSDEFEKLGVNIDIRRNCNIDVYLDNYNIVNNIKQYDFVTQRG